MKIATVLDPRYKLKFMKAFYSTVYGEENSITENEVGRVRSLLYEFVLEYQGSMEGMTTSESVFSTRGRIISPHRSRLAAKTVK
jgi:hypothetical protein